MNKKRKILWVLVVLTVMFIFGQSLLNQSTSNKESTAITEQVIDPALKAVTGSEKIGIKNSTVRDIAHVVEFAALGLELVLLMENKKRIIRAIESIGCCGFVAVIDETIQHFTGRAPQLIDVWHDILGAIVGATVCVVIVALISRNKKETRHNKKAA